MNQSNRQTLSKEKKIELLARARKDTGMFGKLIFPERFHRPFDLVHKRIFEVLDSVDAQKIAIAVPRGLGKTSICNLAIPAKSILFQDSNYIVPVSCSYTQASQQSENLKQKLTSNKLIKNWFGDLSTNKTSKEQYTMQVLGQETCIMPRGAGQQVRGLLYGDSRPDLIVVDDLLDPNQTHTEDQREKIEEWFFGSLMNCVDRGSDDWKIIVLGTVMHPNDLLVKLLNSPNWHSVEIPICNPDKLDPGEFESYAPNFLSDKEVEELYLEFKEEGQEDTFAREYLNQPILHKDAAFRDEMFQGYQEKDHDLNHDSDVVNFLLCDPARTTGANSADSSIVGVAVNVYTSAVYIRDVVADKLHPEQFYEKLFTMARHLNAVAVGVEVTGLHEFITYPLKNEMKRRNIDLQLVDLHARGGRQAKGKAERAKALLPFYRQGMIYHNKTATRALEMQLKAYPRPAKWDIIDALAYLPRMLDVGELFMHPPGEGLQDSEKEVEREYSDILQNTEQAIEVPQVV